MFITMMLLSWRAQCCQCCQCCQRFIFKKKKKKKKKKKTRPSIHQSEDPSQPPEHLFLAQALNARGVVLLAALHGTLTRQVE
jgi:hypothetical protein